MKKETIVCSECESEFFKEASEMKGLCPECAHYLYGYQNCVHQFINDRCIKCYWNGCSTDYINKLKNSK